MNVVDIIILAVLLLSVIYGLFRGFLATVLSVAGVLISIVLALSLGPKLSDALMNNEGVRNTLASYTQYSMKSGSVNDISASQINASQSNWESWVDQALADLKLPDTISNYLRDCLVNGSDFVQSSLESGKERIQNTLVGVVLRVLCCILVFFLSSILMGILGAILRHVASLPVLKQMDALAGGIFGLIRGAVILYVLFLLVPVVTAMVPVQGISEAVSESTLAKWFSGSGFFVTAVNGLFHGGA